MQRKVYVLRDIDFVGAKVCDGEMKTLAAERHVPMLEGLRPLLQAHRGLLSRYVFRNESGEPFLQATYTGCGFR